MPREYKFKVNESDVRAAAGKILAKAGKDPAFAEMGVDDFERLSMIVMESLLEANDERKRRGWFGYGGK